MTHKLALSTSRLQQYLDNYEKHNSQVSASDIAWHIDHCLRVTNGISKTLQNSNPSEYIPSSNFKRSLVLLIGMIPRGRAKAPSTVHAHETITRQNLESMFQKATDNIKMLHSLPFNAHFNHPYFGTLNLKQSIRFIEVHNNHHLKIIRDILK